MGQKKRISLEDKKDFMNLWNELKSVDDITLTYLAGYVHGLKEKGSVSHIINSSTEDKASMIN